MPSKHRRLVAVDAPRAVTGSARKRRGRPLGSPSLTREVEETIVSLIMSGATFAAAAAAAGVSPRTLREWLERGEGRHPTRSSTPKLRRLARRVRQSRGRARVLAENRVYEQNPRDWLRRTARSTAEDEGWADAPNKEGRSGPIGLEIAALSEEELNQALERVLAVATDRIGGSSASPKKSRKEPA